MDKLKLFVPITKIDEEKRLVYGVIAEERIDKSGEIFDYQKSKPHFEGWSKMFSDVTGGKSVGNLRVMHTPKVAGHFEAIAFNDAEKRIEAAAKVTDDVEWKKVLAGDYTGFSIGGRYESRWKDEAAKADRYEASPAETSLVDNPCMYGATFTAIKSDGATELRKFVGGPFVEALNEIVVEMAKSTALSLTGRTKRLSEFVESLGFDSSTLTVTTDATGTIVKVASTAPLPAIPVAPVQKDAEAAIGNANDAIASLKALAVELLTMPGEPDTWTLGDVLSAIRCAISGKITAENAAEAVAAGAGPDNPVAVAAAATPADLTKKKEDPTPKDAPAPAAVPPAQGSESVEAVVKAQLAPVLLKLEAMPAAVVKADLEKFATAEGLSKLVSEVVELRKIVEKIPAPPAGSPVLKTLGTVGGQPAAGSAASIAVLDKLLSDLSGSGQLTPAIEREICLSKASLSLLGQ
jgi:hypothetical protein